MMSKVNSNGPAFLLRMRFVSSHSSGIVYSLPKRCQRVSELFNIHFERTARVLQLPDMIGAKLVYGTNINASRCKWICEIADQPLVLPNGMMKSRVRHDWADIGC